jgi:hypothetical protein
MTYVNRNGTELIAREGYGDLSGKIFDSPGQDRGAAASYCASIYGATSPLLTPCTDHYASGKPGNFVPPAGTPNAGSPSTLSSVGSFVGSLLGGVATSYAGSKGIGGYPPGVYPPGYTPPSPIMPIVVIGGIGLMAVLLLRRPRSNPGRRRRFRRSRRR